MGIISRLLTGYDDDGVSRESWKAATKAEARRQECEQAVHDPRCEDEKPSGRGGKNR